MKEEDLIRSVAKRKVLNKPSRSFITSADRARYSSSMPLSHWLSFISIGKWSSLLSELSNNQEISRCLETLLIWWATSSWRRDSKNKPKHTMSSVLSNNGSSHHNSIRPRLSCKPWRSFNRSFSILATKTNWYSFPMIRSDSQDSQAPDIAKTIFMLYRWLIWE